MANKYLKRRFTMRETILLGVLLAVLLIGQYVGLVVYPIQNRNEQLAQDLDRANLQHQIALNLKAEYDRMKEELDRIDANKDDTMMLNYDNDRQLNELTKEFDKILEDVIIVSPQRFSSSVGAEQDGVLIRTVTINFAVDETCKGDFPTVYDKALDILIKLNTTKYRSSMRSLTLTPSTDGLQKSTSISVAVTIEFFELA